MDHGQLVAEGAPTALIDELGVDTIRLLGNGPVEMIGDRFSNLSFVQSVSRVDGGFLLGVSSSSRHLAEVVAIAIEGDFTIEDVSVAKPDLGAVFFKYTGRQMRNEVQHEYDIERQKRWTDRCCRIDLAQAHAQVPWQ